MTAPVCEGHAKDFEMRGVKTTRVELDEKLERDRKRNTWRAEHQPWRKRV